MTDRELEQRLADAARRAAPDDLDAILSRCGAQNGSVMELKELETGQNIIDVEVTEVRPKKRWRRWLAAACAALVLVGAGGGGLVYQNSYAVASVVSLDVNPSIELKVSRNGKVLSCAALNEEAAAVLFSMDGGADLEGTKLEVAVNAIVGALVREGYLNSVSSAILISVEDKDQERAARLQAELVASVDSVLRGQAPNTSVLSQVLDAPQSEYMTGGLSAGKAALVRKVMEMNGTVVFNDTSYFDQLAALSVEELNDLLKTGEKRIPIGKSAASIAAETWAGTLALNSATTDVDPELDDAPPHYEVELYTAWGKFEYEVDAFTGEILSGPKDIVSAANSGNQGGISDVTPPGSGSQNSGSGNQNSGSGNQNSGSGNQSTGNSGSQSSGAGSQSAGSGSGSQSSGSGSQSAGVITETQAFNAAAEHMSGQYPSLDSYNILNHEVELDWDKGSQIYEVEFYCGGYEFEYKIDARTGAVLKWEADYKETPAALPDPPPQNSPSSGQTVSMEEARMAALAHAGLTEDQITMVEAKWDEDDCEYEFEFWCGNSEYEYTIHGQTCAVLEHEVDHHISHSSGHHSDSHH